MSTIHFKIDDETRRLAMQAAKERQYQDGEHETWLEQELTLTLSRYDAGESQFISDDEMNCHMDKLKAQAAGGKL